MIRFKKKNLQYILDYDYNRSRCHCDDDYCRCTTIEEAWIERLIVPDVVAELSNTYVNSDSVIDEYCFDRLCHIFKVYDKDFYDIDIQPGYYGEEIDGIYFENEEKVVNAFNEILKLEDDIDKIKYCLRVEYKYLIPSVEETKYVSIGEASVKDIVIPNKEYFIRLSENAIEDYKIDNGDLPLAICIHDGNKYKLVDGYHRFVANQDKNEIPIIVLER